MTQATKPIQQSIYLTSGQAQYVADGNRKQKDPHSFSLCQDGQGQAPFHLYPRPFADKWWPKQRKYNKNKILI